MYNKPVILTNDDMAEGVFAAGSNGVDCWVFEEAPSTQSWNGSHNVFELRLHHTAGHISDSVSMVVHMSGAVSDAYSNDNGASVTSISGSDIYVTRRNFGDAENSTDRVTFKLWVSSTDQAMTEALSVSGVTLTNCEKRTSVNGLN